MRGNRWRSNGNSAGRAKASSVVSRGSNGQASKQTARESKARQASLKQASQQACMSSVALAPSMTEGIKIRVMIWASECIVAGHKFLGD